MSDYTADPNYSQEKYSAKTVVDGLNNESSLEADRKTQATAEGVQDARFIGYAEVLDVYQERTDTEHLADRRARHYASDTAAQDFARADDYDGNSGETPDGGTDPYAGP